MKRRTKLFLLLTSLLCLGGGSEAVSERQQNAGKSYPIAVVVLDDASWQLRVQEHEGARGYLWATPDTVLYQQKVGSKYRKLNPP